MAAPSFGRPSIAARGMVDGVLAPFARFLAPMKPVVIDAGRVQSEALEVNAVSHCNIRCRWCSHASPDSSPGFAAEEVVANDLTALARWMHVEHVRVLGGEPLLHPRLESLISAVRRTGVADSVRVLTNGLALQAVSDSFWRLVDEVHVSVYPGTALMIKRLLPETRARAERHGTALVVKHFDHFRVSYRAPDGDRALTGRVYRTCQIANVWRCLTVDAGRLYRCPQSAYLLGSPRGPQRSQAMGVDYLDISTITSAHQVRVWLLRPAPLQSCASCAGSAGARMPHQQMRSVQAADVARDIDFEYLDQLDHDRAADNSCVTDVIEITGQPTP